MRLVSLLLMRVLACSILTGSPIVSRRYRLVAAGLAAAVALALGGCSKPGESSATLPDVQVTKVIQGDVPVTGEWIGTIQGMINANISAKVSGFVLSRNYTEGTIVKKGQLLFLLDPRQYNATLAVANGQLAEAQAKLGKTQLDVTRFTPLAAESAISQQELDDAIQANLAAKAAVDAAQAQVLAAQINVDYCTISSPIDGRSGIANAQVGDLVGPTSLQPLTTVSQVDPVRVYFPVTEQAYIKYANRMAAEGRSMEDPDPRFLLHLFLADGSEYALPGKFYIANRQVDPTTGTILIAGVFANPQFILRPGMYARVRAVTDVIPNALQVPQAAVVQTQGSYQVGVLGPNNTLDLRTVEVGDKIGQDWVITSGLEANDTIVVNGAQKIPPGTPVNPTPYTAPPSADPDSLNVPAVKVTPAPDDASASPTPDSSNTTAPAAPPAG
jgi:membrane fusion protein (multidrug efflux system)